MATKVCFGNFSVLLLKACDAFSLKNDQVVIAFWG